MNPKFNNIERAILTDKKEVIAIEFFNDDIALKFLCTVNTQLKDITAETLDGSAKEVYLFLEKRGFNPQVEYKHDSQQNHAFRITVSIPEKIK